MRLVLIFLTVAMFLGSLGAAAYYYQKGLGDRDALNKERYLRMTAEETLEKRRQDIESLEKRIRQLSDQLKMTQAALAQKTALNEELRRQARKAEQEMTNLRQELDRLEKRLGAQRRSPSVKMAP